MLENTIGSLAGLAGLTWVATQFVKNMMPKAPQNAVALVLGQLATITLWRAGVVHLDGADASSVWGWLTAALYGLFAMATSAKGHELGQEPRRLVARVKGGVAQ
jgi:hypothetical protein